MIIPRDDPDVGERLLRERDEPGLVRRHEHRLEISFCRKRDAIALETERLKSTWVSPRTVTPEVAKQAVGQSIEREYTLHELLRRPDVSYCSLSLIPAFGKPVAKTPVVLL